MAIAVLSSRRPDDLVSGRASSHVLLAPVVPFVHASSAARRIATARLWPFHLAGYILWLGPDTSGMHQSASSSCAVPSGYHFGSG